MARLAAGMGQEDCALEYLEKACDHVIISAEEKPEDKYRSLLLREVEVYYVGSEAAKQLYSFLKPWREKGSPFDSLRDKPRFQAVIERLREYALETVGMPDLKKYRMHRQVPGI